MRLPKTKPVLVTGASGFIGRNMALRLLNEGFRVRAAVRTPAKAKDLEKKGAEIVPFDLLNPLTFKPAISGCGSVFHFAAVLADEFYPYSYFRKVNVEGTRLLALHAIEENVALFVYTASGWVYGSQTKGTVSETSPYRKSGLPYADTKLEGEIIIRTLVKEKGLPAVIVQPADVYGPDDETYIGGPLQMIRNGSFLLPDRGKHVINPIFISDLVEGIFQVACKGRIGEAYILSTEDVVPCGVFFGYLARMINRSEKFPTFPAFILKIVSMLLKVIALVTRKPPLFTREALAGVMCDLVFDGTKAAIELGFKPTVSLEKGMELIKRIRIKE